MPQDKGLAYTEGKRTSAAMLAPAALSPSGKDLPHALDRSATPRLARRAGVAARPAPANRYRRAVAERRAPGARRHRAAHPLRYRSRGAADFDRSRWLVARFGDPLGLRLPIPLGGGQHRQRLGRLERARTIPAPVRASSPCTRLYSHLLLLRDVSEQWFLHRLRRGAERPLQPQQPDHDGRLLRQFHVADAAPRPRHL